jgi:nitroreductase
MYRDSLYNIIFKRKSIRKYDNAKLEAHVQTEIQSYIDQITPMDQDIKTSIKLVRGDEGNWGVFAIKAPYYIVACSAPKGNYFANIGFMLQQVELFLSMRGIGSCWVGMAKPAKELANEAGMEFIIVLAVGIPGEPIHRANVSEFKRRSLAEITNIPDYGENPELLTILEAARLAPSATNSQPWYFSGTPESIIVSRLELNPIKALIYNRMNQVDIGIVLCHVWLAAGKLGKKVIFVQEPVNKIAKIKGYQYITTVQIKSL